MKRTINQTAKRSLKTKKAFTLVELLVVIAIIGILFVVLISKVDFATDKAKTAGVQTDFRSYQMAMKMVGMEQQGFTNDMNKLTAQLNKNLDPKLQVAVVDGKLTTEAEDPWGTAYQFTYGEPANTRGEIVVRSAGPDLQYNTDDDITIVSRYEFGANGGGVVEATESINPLVLYAAPGLYDPDTGEMTKTWDELVEEGVLIINGTSLSSDPAKWNELSGVLSIKNGITAIGDCCFCDGDSQGASYLTGVIIPNSVTSIGQVAFGLCTGLKTVYIPDTVTNISMGAFAHCTSLTSFKIPIGINTIPRIMLAGCSNLAEIVIPSNVSCIEPYAFEACAALTSVVIPESVTSIGVWAFYDCIGLQTVTIKASVPPTIIGQPDETTLYVFEHCDNISAIYVPSGSVGAYRSARGWIDRFDDLGAVFKPIQ